MKRFLSILLSVLMIMSTMSTVALANTDFTFVPTMALEADDVIKAGTKVRFDFTAPTGTEATYYNNGVAVTPAVVETVADEDAGTTTTTVAITVNSGKNVITAKVGDTESEATIINASSYIHQENFYGESVYAAIGTEVEIGGRTGVIKPTSNIRIANGNTKKADIFEVSFDVYLPEFPVEGGKLVGFYYKDTAGSATGYLDQIVNINTDGTTLFPYINLGDYDATGTITDEYKLSAAEWHTVKYYINAKSKKTDYYIDDILIIKDHNLRLPEHDFIQVQCFWTGVWDGLYVDNFQANGMTSTSMTSTIASGTVTAGAKVSVTAKSLEAGQSVVGFINGEATTLGTTDGTYYMTIPAGYSTVSAAILDANGAVVKAASGNELKAEATYAALSLPTDDTVTVITDDDFSANPVASAAMPTIPARNAAWPEEYYNGVVARFNSTYTEMSEGGNPDEMIKIYHDKNAMTHYPLTSPAVDADNDGYTDLKTTTSVANADTIYAGNVIGDFTNVGLIEYSVDIKFGDDWNQGADNYGSLIPFAARPGGTRTWFYPVQLDKNNGGYATTVYKNGGKVTTAHTDIDVTEWHTLKMIMDPTGNRMWIYCDDALIDAGDMGAAAFTSVERIGLTVPRTNSNGKHITMYADNIYYATHSATYPTEVEAEAIEANITDAGASVKIVRSELLESYPDVADATLAIVARAEDRTVVIKTYDVADDTAMLKSFNFDVANIDKIFVWNWANLKPIVKAFTPAQ